MLIQRCSGLFQYKVDSSSHVWLRAVKQQLQQSHNRHVHETRAVSCHQLIALLQGINPSPCLHNRQNFICQISLTPQRCFHTAKVCCHGYKTQRHLYECYRLLELKSDCTLTQLKDAYYEKARIYHPDSQASSADGKKFDQIRDAYRTVKKDIEDRTGRSIDNDKDGDDDEEELAIFARHQIQHRQYLDNEGIGFGTKTERQKQFSQFRVSRAQDRVFDHKLKKLAPEGENSLTAKDKRAARRAKMSNSMDRLVEDMIQESMSRGDFDNLSGRGKPLKFNPESPYADKITQKLNKILIDDGLQPEWIMLHKDIRADIKTWREKLALEHKKLGATPQSDNARELWKNQVETLRTSLLDVNKQIDKLNLIVPVLSKQMVHYQFDREYKAVCDDPDSFLSEDKKVAMSQHSGYSSNLYSKDNYSQRESILSGVMELFFQIKKDKDG